MYVLFNSIEELLAELEAQANKPECVRVTRLYPKQAKSVPQRLFVVATARIGDEIIRCDRLCGELAGVVDEAHHRVLSVADNAILVLERGCKKLNLPLRAGLWEHPERATPGDGWISRQAPGSGW